MVLDVAIVSWLKLQSQRVRILKRIKLWQLRWRERLLQQALWLLSRTSFTVRIIDDCAGNSSHQRQSLFSHIHHHSRRFDRVAQAWDHDCKAVVHRDYIRAYTVLSVVRHVQNDQPVVRLFMLLLFHYRKQRSFPHMFRKLPGKRTDCWLSLTSLFKYCVEYHTTCWEFKLIGLTDTWTERTSESPRLQENQNFSELAQHALPRRTILHYWFTSILIFIHSQHHGSRSSCR